MDTEIKRAPSSLLTYNKIDSASAIAQAEKDGNRVVFPEENQLFIDIDSEEAGERFHRLFTKFKTLIDEDASILYDEPSFTEGHRHIIVETGLHLTDESRLMFQCLLGSDQVRELLAYVRVSEGDEHPSLFIEKPILALPEPKELLALPESNPFFAWLEEKDSTQTNILTDADIPF